MLGRHRLSDLGKGFSARAVSVWMGRMLRRTVAGGAGRLIRRGRRHADLDRCRYASVAAAVCCHEGIVFTDGLAEHDGKLLKTHE